MSWVHCVVVRLQCVVVHSMVGGLCGGYGVVVHCVVGALCGVYSCDG